jgi:hypothetical protein
LFTVLGGDSHRRVGNDVKEVVERRLCPMGRRLYHSCGAGSNVDPSVVGETFAVSRRDALNFRKDRRTRQMTMPE